MTKEEFLKSFTNHVRRAKNIYNKEKFLHDLKEGKKCPFHVENLEKASYFGNSVNLKETKEFSDASGHYIFNRIRLEKEMLEIIEREWV